MLTYLVYLLCVGVTGSAGDVQTLARMLPGLWTRAICLPSLNFNFLTCKTELIQSALWSFENFRRERLYELLAWGFARSCI